MKVYIVYRDGIYGGKEVDSIFAKEEDAVEYLETMYPRSNVKNVEVYEVK
jgi:hypothetical protein